LVLGCCFFFLESLNQYCTGIRAFLITFVTYLKIMKNKKTLVLGATTKPERYAFRAINMLTQKGHTVLAIGQNTGEVAGVKIYTKAIPVKNIDTVTLYLNPARQRDYYNYIIEAQPKRVIFNPGSENPEMYQLLELNNIKFEIACTLVLLATNQY
jgi:predicted CoA-binding protein